MKTAWLCLIGLACICHAAGAQVPETGRWQELAFSSDDVHERTEDRYLDIVIGLAEKGQLDTDRALLDRVAAIGASLIRAAAALKPQSAAWQWEIHTTSDPDLDAFCMAGGKILVGNQFIQRLELNDGELAMLLGHEIAHALAEHHREELSEALHIIPQQALPLEVVMARLDSDLSLQFRLADLSNLQESEADQLGMVLLHQAGWPVEDMVNFYRKLGKMELTPMLSSSHPKMTARLSMAMGMARLLGVATR